MDARANFAYATVKTAPSPAISGLALVLETGEGARMPGTPFNAVVAAIGGLPLSSTAEIVRVTNVASDTLTIERAQEGSAARTVLAGDQFFAGVTAHTFAQFEEAISAEESRAQTAEAANATAITNETTRAKAGEKAAQEAAEAASAQGLNPTAVKNAAYEAKPGDYIPVDISAAAVALTLPNAPPDKTRVGVKIVKVPGTPGEHTLMINCAGADVFNIVGGSTTLTLSALFHGMLLQYAHATGIWYVQTTDTPLNEALGAALLGTDGTVGGPSGSPLTPTFADVVAPVATGVAATDTAVLKAAITATPAGGSLLLSGHYKINATLERATPITIRGRSMNYQVGKEKGTPPSGPTELAQIKGTIIEQTKEGVDNFLFTGSAASLKMSDLCVAFTATLPATGHGINCTPSEEEEGHPATGVYGGSWDNVFVIGHDGSHYGLVLVNHVECTSRDFRAQGGGGILEVANHAKYNTGNTVHIHPYVDLQKEGTAHGYARSSATSYPEAHGCLNLVVLVRPQCNISGTAGTKGTQATFTDGAGAGWPARCTVYDPDFESWGYTNPCVYGPGTEHFGNTSNTVNLANIRIGFLAGSQADLEGVKQNIAIGQEALEKNKTNQNIGIGVLAGQKITTGASNVLVGQQALQNATTSAFSVALGAKAGLKPNGAEANATVKGNYNILLGTETGAASAADPSAMICIGYQAITLENGIAIGRATKAEAKGAIAIGRDAGGTSAATAVENEIALGTASHLLKLSNSTTGASEAKLGANCPATTLTAPSTWIRVHNSSGELVYIPAWK